MKTLKYSTCNEPEGDPDYTKVTTEEAKHIAEAEKSGFVNESDIDWDNLTDDYIENLTDYFLLSEAEKRMAGNNDSENNSHEQMLKELGITEKDLDGIDVEIEYIYSELEVAEKQVKQGKVLDADESLAQIKKKYNI